jgi:NADH:ubiquinone oxidoreductase subunit 4 (subunit M)
MSRVEVLTLAPLAALTLIIGIYPAIVLDFIQVPVNEILAQLHAGASVGLLP